MGDLHSENMLATQVCGLPSSVAIAGDCRSKIGGIGGAGGERRQGRRGVRWPVLLCLVTLGSRFRYGASELRNADINVQEAWAAEK